jgi:tetratricopeptide (TPR) repeat protein
MLEVLLRAKYPQKNFEVVNVAITAINSHVIRDIARDCASRQGELWVIYMGNNEVVGPFGAGTVFGAQSPSMSFIRASLAVKSLRTGQFLDAAWRHFARAPFAEWEGMEMFLKQQVRHDDSRMPAVYEHFAKNLDEILRVGTGCGAKVLLSTVASNLKDCPPFASLHRADLTEHQRSKWESLYQAGITAEATTNYSEALTNYRQAAQIDNRYAELFFRIGRCQWALASYSEARLSFERARDLDTLRFRADSRINQLTRQAAAMADPEQVQLLDAVELFGENSPHQIPGEEFLFEHVHLNFAGNYLMARTLAAKIETAWPALLGTARTNTDALLSKEECARRLAFTDWDQYQVLDEMLKRLGQPPFTQQLDHQSRDARLTKARDALQPMVHGEALSMASDRYRQALILAPADWVLHEHYAKLLEGSGDPPAAEKEWRKVIELMPHYAPAYYSLGNVLDGQGKSAEAIHFFEQALHRRPESIEAHNGLGLALAGQGKTAEAMREYETALARKPGFAEARVNLGQTLAEQGKVDEAAAQYEMALRENSNNVAAHINLGKLLASQKKFAAAAEHYESALRIKPDHAVAHFNLGNSLAALGRSPEALDHFAQSVRWQPNFPEARYNLGLELAKAGRTKEALEQLAEAVRLKPGFADAHLNFGVALAKSRQFDQAVQQFQEVLRLEPANAAARKFLDQALALRQNQ